MSLKVDYFKLVNDACIPQMESLLREISPKISISGGDFLILNPNRDDKNLGSLRVSKATGAWIDHATDEHGGDFVSLWAFARNIGNREAKDDLAHRVGIQLDSANSHSQNDGVAIVPVPENAPVPDWNSLGNPKKWAYLDSDGHLMRWHLRWDEHGEKRYSPLTWRRMPSGGCEWRKKGLPGEKQPIYGLDRLGKDLDASVLVCEGEKAADAASKLFPEWVCITTGSSSSARKADLTPLQGRVVTIWPDNDEPGQRYATDIAQLLRKVASLIRIVKLPDGLPKGWDLADQVPDTMDALDLGSSLIEACEPAAYQDGFESEEMPTPQEILIRPPEFEVKSQAQEALARLGCIYQRRGSLVHVFRAESDDIQGRLVPKGTPAIRTCTLGWIREQLSKAAVFTRQDREGGSHRSLVPEWLPGMLRESSEHKGLPELTAVVEVPVFLEDGSILTKPGLDSACGIYFAPLHSTFPTIPERPSFDEARLARETLFGLVKDFPWASKPSPEGHRAAWLAFLLTPFARYAIQGAVPFVLIEANGQAAGKGLLAQVTARIPLGRELPTTTAPKDGEELRKMALPIVLEGTRIQFLDESGPFFGSREFNGMVTGTVLKDRVLGSSLTLEAPMNTLWVTAGNNVSLGPDTARRCLSIRLEPLCERPEDRDNFTIPDLMGYTQKHQAELAASALTILRAFHVAGRPSSGLKPWGSFEAWTRLIRDCVYWITEGVDCDTRPALAEFADGNRASLLQLIEGLNLAFPNTPFTADQIFKLLERKESEDPSNPCARLRYAGLIEAIEALNTNPKGPCTKSIGKILGRARRSVMGKYLIDQVGKISGSALWKVQKVQEIAA